MTWGSRWGWRIRRLIRTGSRSYLPVASPGRGAGSTLVRMRNLLLILWLALLGATRIDLLGGAGPFVLTPFLVIAPIVVAVELWLLAAGGWRVRIPSGAGSFLLALSALMALLLISTFLSYDLPSSGRRISLLLVQVALVFLVGIAVANRADPQNVLLKGAYAGLAASLLFDVAQILVWFNDSIWPEGLQRVIDLEPGVYFAVVPRLTGLAHDPNLGGLLMVFFIAIIALHGRPTGLRNTLIGLGVLAIGLTLSRSAMLAGIVLWLAIVLNRLDMRVSAKGLATATALAACATGAYLVLPALLEPVVDLGGILANRFTFSEGSAGEHADLLSRGWEVGTASVKRVLIGIGYGNAYVTVQDIFPGNVYGNFHSLFVTLFAESGAFAALLALWIFTHLLLGGSAYRPLIAAMLAYNLFQQAHTDPVLWLSFMLAWLGIGLKSGRAVPSRAVLGRPESPRMAMVGVLCLFLAGCSEIVGEPFHYGTVEVSATRRSGEPVPGVRLVLYTGTRHLGYGATDDNGNLVFSFVPEGSMGVGTYPPDGYRPLDLTEGYYTYSTFSLGEGEHHWVDFTYLKFGPGSVSVRIMDLEGKPIPGLPIQLYLPAAVFSEGTSDSVGEHTFEDVPFGFYGVRVIADRRFLVPSGSVFQDGLIVEDGVQVEATFELEYCRGLVRARTSDRQGTPIAGIGVSLYQSDGVVETSETGASGVREFGAILCGDYGVRVGDMTGYTLISPASGFVDGLVVEHGSERVADFVLEPCRGTVLARVLDSGGAPVTDAGVALYDRSGELQQVLSGSDGFARLQDIPCGTDYGVRVLPPAGFAVEEGRGSSYFDGFTIAAEAEVSFTFMLTRS